MFKGHPKGLIVLALSNMGERFGYYTMLAILALYIQAKFGLGSKDTSLIYGTFLAMVYFLPLLGGIIADKFLGYGKTILIGILIMFCGYFMLAIPSKPDIFGYVLMFGALTLISLGTGFFKGNLQALVGNLYESSEYAAKRDIAFSLFYMFINIGAFFAPSAANLVNNAILAKDNYSYNPVIPTNFVKLNDKIVDDVTFTKETFAACTKKLESKKDSVLFLNKAKKKAGVLFVSDRKKIEFNLKAAGLAQANKISLDEYKGLESRDLAEKEKIVTKVNSFDFNGLEFSSKYMATLTKSYNIAFGIACISLIISIIVFLGFKKLWKSVDFNAKQLVKSANSSIAALSKEQIRNRVLALIMVYFVVIFFWMSFHQNGLCMTYFARDYTFLDISPIQNLAFSLFSLIPFFIIVYGLYSAIGVLGEKKKLVPGLVIMLLGLTFIYLFYFNSKGIANIKITPQIFQQFNPYFIVLLTPLSVFLFSYLNKRGIEPSAPKKIGIGMIVAGLGFCILIFSSFGLPSPSDLTGISDVLVSPNWLISSYFVLTIAELFLSPMGISFVSKVAPPQYKGLMQGGWLAATAVGNYLVGVMGVFWDELPLWVFWSILVVFSLISAIFIFSIMKRLENATK
jgi:POT family proton-dependent oligopeptide transporter